MGKAETEVKMKELISQLENHPLAKKIREDQAAETLATRVEVARKIEALRKEQDEVIPKLQADMEIKEANCLKAKISFNATADKHRMAKAALLSEVHSFNAAIGTLEATLIETADPLIDETIQFFTEKLSYLRSPGRLSQIAGTPENNIFAWTRTVRAESNHDAVVSALKYCRDAITSLNEMKLLPTVDIKRIQELKDSIPSIDEFREVTGEKPMKRINADARSMLPSDSQIEWQMGKLNDKFKKVMGRI